MNMGFKKYFEDLTSVVNVNAPTATYHGPAPTRVPTRPDDSEMVDDFNSGLQRQTTSPGDHPPSPTTSLSRFFDSVQMIDPWLTSRRGPGYFGGTLDYLAPEIAKGDRNFDQDSLNDLYNTLSRTRPDAVAMLKPLLASFAPFHQAVVKMYNSARSSGLVENNNPELAFRLDARKADQIVRGVSQTKQALARITGPEVAAVQGLFNQVKNTFAAFHQQFQQVFPGVLKHLQQSHDQIAGQAWDKTR